MSGFEQISEDCEGLTRMRCISEESDSSCSSSTSGEKRIVFIYILCRDQNEREDEELWVSNEATDPGGAYTASKDQPHPSYLSPVAEGWGGLLVVGLEGEGQFGVSSCWRRTAVRLLPLARHCVCVRSLPPRPSPPRGWAALLPTVSTILQDKGLPRPRSLNLWRRNQSAKKAVSN